MTMKKVLLYLVVMLPLVAISAQTPTKVSPCFHDEVIKFQNEQTPQYKAVVDRTYAEMLHQAKTLQTRDDKVYTINVVFHVVYKNDEENISDARINDEIAVLNENYRRKNRDTSKTRPIFKSVAGDAGIEFKLHRIVRVKTTATFAPDLLSQTNQIPNQVKRTADGGSNAIDPNKYMNVWVCKIEPLEILGLKLGSVLGFAYPPAGLANWPDGASAPSKELDGIVVDYRTVGRTGLSYPHPTNGGTLAMQGRTLVHETGHYLGLRHIWGDGSLLGASCSGEDGIADTPKASSQSQFDCDTTKNTCVDAGAIDYPDMIENFMDYSEEGCQNMFTKGQVGIMRSVLQGPRKLLVDNTASAIKDIVEFDAHISPNPTNGNIYFDWRETKDCAINIVDIYGRNVLSIPNAKSQMIDMQNFNTGIYFFEIKANNQYQIVKIVKSH
jgi:hypothetical protein